MVDHMIAITLKDNPYLPSVSVSGNTIVRLERMSDDEFIDQYIKPLIPQLRNKYLGYKKYFEK